MDDQKDKPAPKKMKPADNPPEPTTPAAEETSPGDDWSGVIGLLRDAGFSPENFATEYAAYLTEKETEITEPALPAMFGNLTGRYHADVSGFVLSIADYDALHAAADRSHFKAENLHQANTVLTTERDDLAARLAKVTAIDPAERLELTAEEAEGFTVALRSMADQRHQALGMKEAAFQDAFIARLKAVIVSP